jgi:hypothetical protein
MDTKVTLSKIKPTIGKAIEEEKHQAPTVTGSEPTELPQLQHNQSSIAGTFNLNQFDNEEHTLPKGNRLLLSKNYSYFDSIDKRVPTRKY